MDEQPGSGRDHGAQAAHPGTQAAIWNSTYFFCFLSSSRFRLCWLSSKKRVSSRSQVRRRHFLFSC